MNRTLLAAALLLPAVLPALSAAESTGDVVDVVQVRSLTQESGVYDRLWQPFIARWDERQLLVTFGQQFDGTSDMGDVVCCRSTDNGATWKAPVPVFQSRLPEAGGVQYAYANSVLYHPPGQDIVWCFAMKCPRSYPDSIDSTLCAAYTPDGGRSWHPVELTVHYHSPLITNSGIFAAKVDGQVRYLLAACRSTKDHDPLGDSRHFVLESTNLIVWRLAGYVPQEEPLQVALSEGNIDAGDKPGELKMVMRTAPYVVDVRAGRVSLDPPVAYSSVSRDGGRTWSVAQPEPRLYNTDAKGFYSCVSNGRHIYVYNDGRSHERRALRYVVQSAAGDWSEPRTFYDGHVRNSYATLIEDTTPGVYLCVWDSSNQPDRMRTAIRFGRLRLDR